MPRPSTTLGLEKERSWCQKFAPQATTGGLGHWVTWQPTTMNRIPGSSWLDWQFFPGQFPVPLMAKAVDIAQARSFEAALAELEAIVARMEGGQMNLEESLQSYRRGAELVRLCQTRLADAEQQVRVLEGDLLKPFAGDPSES